MTMQMTDTFFYQGEKAEAIAISHRFSFSPANALVLKRRHGQLLIIEAFGVIILLMSPLLYKTYIFILKINSIHQLMDRARKKSRISLPCLTR